MNINSMQPTHTFHQSDRSAVNLATKMDQRFTEADADQNGSVSLDEKQATAREGADTERLEKLFDKMDLDGNGEYTRSEQMQVYAQRVDAMSDHRSVTKPEAPLDITGPEKKESPIGPTGLTGPEKAASPTGPTGIEGPTGTGEKASAVLQSLAENQPLTEEQQAQVDAALVKLDEQAEGAIGEAVSLIRDILPKVDMEV